MNKGVCKLCGIEKDLCKKSHILPKHSYKILKEGDYCLCINKDTINKESRQKDYSGLFEKDILCEDCESLFSNSETYAYELIYENKIKNVNREIKDNCIIVSGEGYDYKKIKLYFLSILWKSSISSKDFFKDVKLSDEDEKNIRHILLSKEKYLSFKNISIFLTLPPLINGVFNGFDILVTEKPYKNNLKGQDVYKFLLTGQGIYFVIGNSNLNSIERDSLKIYLLSEDQITKQRTRRVQQIKNLTSL